MAAPKFTKISGNVIKLIFLAIRIFLTIVYFTKQYNLCNFLCYHLQDMVNKMKTWCRWPSGPQENNHQGENSLSEPLMGHQMV